MEQRTRETRESEVEDQEDERQWEGSHESPSDPVLVAQASDNSPAPTGRMRPKQHFFPVGYKRARVLRFAQFDDELLENVRNLNVPVLHDAIWVPNRDGELSGGFGHVEKALWKGQDIGVKFLKGT